MGSHGAAPTTTTAATASMAVPIYSGKTSEDLASYQIHCKNSRWSLLFRNFAGPKATATEARQQKGMHTHTHIHTYMHTHIHTYTSHPSLACSLALALVQSLFRSLSLSLSLSLSFFLSLVHSHECFSDQYMYVCVYTQTNIYIYIFIRNSRWFLI